MPLTGRLTERVSYGNKYKHYQHNQPQHCSSSPASMLSQSLARLSSGSKVTSPADDSAGLAVSMSLVAQEGENTAASNNIADAISFNQTQDGYLPQVSSALDRMSELAVQAQDVTKSSTRHRSSIKTSSTRWRPMSITCPRKTSTASVLFNGTSLNVTIDSEWRHVHDDRR